MEEKEKKMDGKKAKINNWIENILVFVVIPLVLFLLFLRCFGQNYLFGNFIICFIIHL